MINHVNFKQLFKSILFFCLLLSLNLSIAVKERVTAIEEKLKRESKSPAKKLKDFEVKDKKIQFTDIKSVGPGQTRYSEPGVNRLVSKVVSDGHAFWSVEKGWRGLFDNGNAVIADQWYFPVLIPPQELLKNQIRYIAINDHHGILASMALFAKTIPIQIQYNFSKLSIPEFMKIVKENNLLYPYNEVGQSIELPKSLESLKEDPNRIFGGMVIAPCTRDDKLRRDRIEVDYPLAVNTGIPFEEFFIGDNLRKHGLVYNNETGEELNKLIEQARKIMIQNPVKNIYVITDKTHKSLLPDNICVKAKSIVN